MILVESVSLGHKILASINNITFILLIAIYLEKFNNNQLIFLINH